MSITENKLEELSNENMKIKNMNQQFDKQINISRNKSNDLNSIITKKETEIKLLQKNNKKLSEEKDKIALDFKTFKEIIITTMQSKVKIMKNQLSTIKDSYLNEIQSIKIENKKLLDNFVQTFSNSLVSGDKNYSTIKKSNDELLEKNESLLSELKDKEDIITYLKKNITNILSEINNTKNYYEREFIRIINCVQNLSTQYQIDLDNKDNKYQNKIESLQNQLNKEINNKKFLENDNTSKSNDISNFQECFSKLKSVYENKINLLNEQIRQKEKFLGEKEMQLKQLSDIIDDEKNQNKNLCSKLELAKKEVINCKKNNEKIIIAKDNKIKQLQQIVNQSFSSLNKGVDNIQLAKKLDNEVQQLIHTVKKNHQRNFNDI